MSFYGNVTYYLTNAFGRMVFQNYAVLDKEGGRATSQKNNWMNGASHLAGNSMFYKIDFSPANRNDAMILATGNRWLTFAKNNSDNDEINGDNTLLLYHTLPTEFVNPTEDGANNAYGPGGAQNEDHILNKISKTYYPVREVVGRNCSQNPDQTNCFPEISSATLQNEIAGMQIPANIEELSDIEIEDLKGQYNLQIPYSNWGDLIALPQIMFDEAGHVVYGGYNYIRLQQAPQTEVELNEVQGDVAGILHILLGSPLQGAAFQDPDEVDETYRQTFSGGAEYTDSYYTDQIQMNIVQRLSDHDSKFNTIYYRNDSQINKIKLQIGMAYENENHTISDIPATTSWEDISRPADSLMRRFGTIQAGQTTLDLANLAIKTKIDSIILYLRGESQTIPTTFTEDNNSNNNNNNDNNP